MSSMPTSIQSTTVVSPPIKSWNRMLLTIDSKFLSSYGSCDLTPLTRWCPTTIGGPLQGDLPMVDIEAICALPTGRTPPSA